MPYPESTSIGIITYNNIVQLYTSTSSDVSVVYMSDIITPFCPLSKTSLFFNLAKERDKIENILNRISTLFASATKSGSTFGSAGSSAGSAIKAAVDILKNSIGRILWFCISIPSLGYGRLINRNNSQLYNTEKERQLYCRSNVYNDILETCREKGVGIDVFACNNGEMDLASIAALSTDTGGELYYYKKFNIFTYCKE